ncbi:MAG: FkbM family methyltransferase [Puniceicoccales bacterium]|jgi:FkbM family methyltransferase|nr:FkbM family methyltransferase [Puniceicoccales bacterium]
MVEENLCGVFLMLSNAVLATALCATGVVFCGYRKRVKKRKAGQQQQIVELQNRITHLSECPPRGVEVLNCPKSIAQKLVFVSYAQNFEDLILYDALGDVQDVFYIDVGANLPTYASVTKFFYEKGYHGINIEPLLKEYGELARERDRDTNLCVCAGKKEGELELYEQGGLSTLDIGVAKTWPHIPKPRKVSIVPLSKICEQYCKLGQEIQFCKIDVEGFEREVLLGFDFKNFRPKIFVMEATEPCTMIPTHQKWEDILFDNGYLFAYQCEVNRYYIDGNFPELKDKFIGIEALMDKYVIIKP